MSVKEVVDKILADANGEAERIRSEAAEALKAQDDNLAEQLAAYEKETQMLAAKAAEDKKQRMLAATRMDIRKDILTRKVALIEEVFAKARQQIKSLSDEDYEQLISSLMQKAVETGDEKVVIGTSERRINDRLIKNVNRQLGTGYKGNLHLSQTRANIDGGFILERGRMQVNVSIDVLLAQARVDLEMELSEELFG
jgi:V/A-type H+-transporting ATPase subunit E